MRKKSKKSKSSVLGDKKDEEVLTKSKSEMALVSSQIPPLFGTAETIAVDPEFKEVSFYVDQSEYDTKKRDFETPVARFKFEKGDSGTMALYFTYDIKQ